MDQSLQIHIYESTSALPDTWNASLPVNHNLQSKQLNIIEQSKVIGMQPLYIMAQRNGVVVAQAYAQLLRFKPQFLSKRSLGIISCSLLRGILACLPLKLLAFGHLFRHDGAFVYFNNCEEADQLSIYHQMVNAAMAFRRHNAVMFKDLPPNLKAIDTLVPNLTSFENDVSMCLKIPETWQSFNDYKQALKHKYTQRCNKTLKAFKDVAIKDLDLTEITTQKQQIFNLYQQVTKRQSVTLGLLNEDYFVNMKSALAERLHVQGIYYQQQLVAFTSAIYDDNVYDMNYIGIDYSYNQKLQLYFNILFKCLDNAIEKKCTKLILGRTALEAKAIVGCSPEEKIGYYRINNQFLRKAAARLSNNTLAQQGERWKDRHPFTSEYYEANK